MLEGVDAAQIALVIQWGSDRRICQNSTAAAQAVKTVEEANELLEAASNNDFSEYRDAVGDILVTLILGLKIANDRNGSSFSLNDCLGQAYREIKDRKGYLSEEGIFVKEE